MRPFLSKRIADTSRLISLLGTDKNFGATFLNGQPFDLRNLNSAVDYVRSTYNTSGTDAEEAINHLIRKLRLQRTSILTNRVAQEQHQITIPGTTEHGPRQVPISKPPHPSNNLTVDATPPGNEEQKTEDLTKPVVDTGASRQQKLLNSIKALKVACGEVAHDMYANELLDEHLDKVVSKCIDAISQAQADQTADSVKSMASPLIGEQ